MATNTNPWFTISLIFISVWLQSHVSLAANSISSNQFISGDDSLVSANGIFELGFFRGESSNYYIGIKDRTGRIVWVANREKSVSDSYFSEFRISNGNLVLFNELKIPIWSTNLNSKSTISLKALVLDEGNLVLVDGSNSNSIQPFWQSFDHPTNTWLPGMKLRVNKQTSKTQFLTSWKNDLNPSPGLFSLELDTSSSNELILKWNKSLTYWNSGNWTGQYFSGITEMSFNISYVKNENESYFIYSPSDNFSASSLVMDVSGQIKQFLGSWNTLWSQPKQQCEVYTYCGAFATCNISDSTYTCDCVSDFRQNSENDWSLGDHSGGCARETSLNCENFTMMRNGKKYKFVANHRVRLDNKPEMFTVGNVTECESICLSNCSCTAYAYDNNGCSIWSGDLMGLQRLFDNSSDGITLNIKIATSEVKSASNDRTRTSKGRWILIGVLAGLAGILTILSIVFLCIRPIKTKPGKMKQVEPLLVIFGYKDLQNATKNFSERLGGGGFGSVFKGVLPDSSVIAVKKLESVNQGEKQFRCEVNTIGMINHVNLVRFRGFCSQGSKKLLVYDYMPNGSLESHLFHEKHSKVLVWKTRYEIALGTARGLTYLHEKCRDCIIHCDIKPENILLDADFCPKVADFGLAKLIGRDFSRVLTTMRGTIGYLAPEWISGVAITEKADVYSYGMLLLELVSGKRNSTGQGEYFPCLVANRLSQGGSDLFKLLDTKLEMKANEEELTRICRVACWCIQDAESHRPSMGKVVQILEGILDVNIPPHPRNLYLLATSDDDSIVFFTESLDDVTSSP